MNPPPSHHRQHRGAPALSPHATRAENSPPATQSQSEAPEKESEDEVLIRLRGECFKEIGGIDWTKVSKRMKAEGFDHSERWCKHRYSGTLDPTKRKAWSPDEDAKLKELKGKSKHWDWEVIASGMAKKEFYRDPVSCRNRWQDALRPQPSSKGERFSREEEAMLKALRRAGHTFREIADQFERRGWHRDHGTLYATHDRLIEDGLDEISA